MQSVIQSGALVSHVVKTDAPKMEERLKLRVKFNDFGSRFFEAGGSIVSRPKVADEPVELTVYASQLAELDGLVETRADVVPMARRAAFEKIRREAARKAAIPLSDLGDDPETWEDEHKKEFERTGESTEKEFYLMTGRGIAPLASYEIVERIAAPQDQETVRTASLVAQIAAAMQSPQILEMQRQIEELKKQLKK